MVASFLLSFDETLVGLKPGFPAEALGAHETVKDLRHGLRPGAQQVVFNARLLRVRALGHYQAVVAELVVGQKELLARAVGNVVAQVVDHRARLEEGKPVGRDPAHPFGHELRADAVVASRDFLERELLKPVAALKPGFPGYAHKFGDVRQILFVRFHLKSQCRFLGPRRAGVPRVGRLIPTRSGE